MTDKVKLICKFCGGHSGFIRKYGLNLCRRCFKDKAKELGFEKFS